jgi:NAD(P)-dependent dehydrogenase (short-subunit alcohol dehydrogenase family)
MTGRLAGKVALITGGARGIGGATAMRFAAEGASVVIGDLLESEGAGTAEAIRAAGGRAHVVRTDVTDEEDCRVLAAAAAETFGRLDCVVTCAGILQGAYAALEDLELEIFERVQNVNVRGTFLTVKHAVPYIKRSGGGVVLCISSGAGVKGSSSSIAYGTSKAGVHGMVMTLQPRLDPQGIRVHAICPGSIDTPLKRENVADAARAAGRAIPEALANAGLGDPDGVARVLAFLASDDAAFVRGTIFTR